MFIIYKQYNNFKRNELFLQYYPQCETQVFNVDLDMQHLFNIQCN